MKTILLALALILTGFELWAQPAPGMPPTVPRHFPPRFGNTNGPATLPRYQPSAPAPMTSYAAPAAPAQPEEIIPAGTINFQGVDVSQVLEIYAQLVGRTLLRAGLPSAQIVLKTQTPLTKTEAIEALQAVLALNGIAVVNIGDKFVKVGPVDQANSFGAEFNDENATNLPNLGSYVTHIVQLKYVKPSEMVPIIQPFAKLANSILSIDSNGILVLRDNAENVKRMLEMIEKVDVSVPAEYVSEVIPIRYAKVDDIASALNSLGGGGSGASVSIGSAPSPGRISGLAGNQGGGTGGGGIGGNNYQSGGMGGTTSAFGNRTGFGAGGTGGVNGTPTGGTTFQQRLQSIIGRASGGGQQDQIQLFGQTKIIPNESSSSLLIYATRPDMEVIKGIIAKLDVPLAQVLIEAVIMDVTIGDTFNLGVSAVQQPKQFGNSITGGGAMINGGSSFLNTMQTLVTNGSGSSILTSSSLPTNAFSSGLNYFGNIGPTWDVAVTAAESDSHASIIQRPRIQTSQAQPAQFFVGESVPYITGSYSYNGVQNSYSQLSVGVELDVTPFINPEGAVSMQIQQEIDEVENANYNNSGQPSTIKRTLNTTITVRDRDTVMLGGFIKSDKSHSQSGVPFLSDIPILGNLFKQRNDAKDRQELIVLVRPTVLQTPELSARNTIKEEQRLPGVSQAAAEDAAEERKLIDAQRKREQKKFNATKQYDGFFNPEPEAIPTNTVVPASAIIENSETNVPDGAVTQDFKDAQDRARTALDEKLKELNEQQPAPAQAQPPQ